MCGCMPLRRHTRAQRRMLSTFAPQVHCGNHIRGHRPTIISSSGMRASHSCTSAQKGSHTRLPGQVVSLGLHLGLWLHSGPGSALRVHCRPGSAFRCLSAIISRNWAPPLPQCCLSLAVKQVTGSETIITCFKYRTDVYWEPATVAEIQASRVR